LRYPELARHAYWLESLLTLALSGELVALGALEFRHEPAGFTDVEVDQLHADGSYIRSVTTASGPGTVYRDGDAQVPVPDGYTLLMTALDRARGVGVLSTLHRRPGAGPERTVIVASFEQGHDHALPAKVYRQFAAAQLRGAPNPRRQRLAQKP
jgi:hypothetical protein